MNYMRRDYIINKRKVYIDHIKKLELERFKLVKDTEKVLDDIEKTKELLESYEKNSLSNENIIENKNNLVHTII